MGSGRSIGRWEVGCGASAGPPELFLSCDGCGAFYSSPCTAVSDIVLSLAAPRFVSIVESRVFWLVLQHDFLSYLLMFYSCLFLSLRQILVCFEMY